MTDYGGKMDIITDHKWKNFKYGYEVPKKVLDDYDWLSDDDKFDGWFKYRNNWYHLSDFMDCHNQMYSPNNPFRELGYDGYLNDTFFSGLLIKLSEDLEQYQVALFLS